MKKVVINENLDKAYIHDETLSKIDYKKNINRRNAYYLTMLANETDDKDLVDKLIKRANKMLHCMEFWNYEKYDSNKVLDLIRVNRCNDIFCPNCRRVNLNKAINHFSAGFGQMIDFEYMPLFMTLTIPNMSLDDINSAITKMGCAYKKLWGWLYYPEKKKGFTSRLFDIKGAVRMVELTINKYEMNCNLHNHSIIFIDNFYLGDFDKLHEGYYRKKINDVVYLSDADIFISKLWTMAFDGLKIKEFKNMTNYWRDNYICDIRECDIPEGLNEAFKYCFKDSDIADYEIFKKVFYGIYGKRLRQSYGMLYDFKDELSFNLGIKKEKVGIEEYLKFKDEKPDSIYIKSIKKMTEKYKEYKKISRFSCIRNYINTEN